MNTCNSKEGIESFLTDLDGLTRLYQARRAAYANNGFVQDLREFIVLGKWHLDSCGNLWRTEITLGGSKEGMDLSDQLPKVILKDDLWKILPQARLKSHGVWIPRFHVRCPECTKGWTTETAHEAHSIQQLVKNNTTTPFTMSSSKLNLVRVAGTASGVVTFSHPKKTMIKKRFIQIVLDVTNRMEESGKRRFRDG
jgi:hypothetical protein